MGGTGQGHFEGAWSWFDGGVGQHVDEGVHWYGHATGVHWYRRATGGRWYAGVCGSIGAIRRAGGCRSVRGGHGFESAVAGGRARVYGFVYGCAGTGGGCLGGSLDSVLKAATPVGEEA